MVVAASAEVASAPQASTVVAASSEVVSTPQPSLVVAAPSEVVSTPQLSTVVAASEVVSTPQPSVVMSSVEMVSSDFVRVHPGVVRYEGGLNEGGVVANETAVSGEPLPVYKVLEREGKRCRKA
jgi:hypothetical protein